MKAFGKMVLILLSFLAFAHCTDVQTAASGDQENGMEPNVVGAGGVHPESHEPNATAATGRTGRQYYHPATGFAYQPYPQRRAYKGPYPRMRQRTRAKPGRRQRPRRRPTAGPPPAMPMQSRYRRLPPTMRPQHTNYIDSPPLTDYDDGFESFDYGERELFDREPAAAYVHYGPDPIPMAVVPSPSSPVRFRKRPVQAATDETQQAIVHVPVRVQARPFATAAPTVAATPTVVTVDPMEKLRQMVQEAMDEHFANRHQELYADGFDKQQQQQQQQQQQHNGLAKYSAKYKRQQAATTGEDKQQRSADATAAASAVVSYAPSSSSSSAKKSDVSYPSRTTPSDADADGSDNRLTLAEISAYMGSKPAETVLSTSGRRYVLSDALQHIYERPQPDHQHQQQRQYDGEDHQSLHRGQQYLRYVSPFEAIYELPAARWTYK